MGSSLIVTPFRLSQPVRRPRRAAASAICIPNFPARTRRHATLRYNFAGGGGLALDLKIIDDEF